MDPPRPLCMHFVFLPATFENPLLAETPHCGYNAATLVHSWRQDSGTLFLLCSGCLGAPRPHDGLLRMGRKQLAAGP